MLGKSWVFRSDFRTPLDVRLKSAGLPDPGAVGILPGSIRSHPAVTLAGLTR
jgi:hypothetical protein